MGRARATDKGGKGDGRGEAGRPEGEARGGLEGRGPDGEACWAGRLPTEVHTRAEWGGGRRRKKTLN